MNRLHRIRSSWHRFVINLCLFGLLLINRFTSPRAKIHWVGRYRRRRRPERVVFAIVFLGTLLAAGPQRHMTWMTSWGGMLAIFLDLLMVYQAFPRKRVHWVK